jgi:UDP-4-amino-4,6-dideoxy-N-acetyl-beta-L-altrosamine transaminase
MTMDNAAFLPYSRQRITQDDIDAVTEVLRSDWLTQGPAVPAFEDNLADYLGAREAVACSSGTAALHLAMLTLGLGPGDTVIVPANTFVATANCARFVGADVLFADIDSSTGLIDPAGVAELLNRDNERKIKAVIPVHFAGQPADLPALYGPANRHGAWLVDDACHALGAAYNHDGQRYAVGNNPHSDLTVFSFHPVKHIATGEGGAVATNHNDLADRLRLFRSHGIRRQDFADPQAAYSSDGIPNPWYYEMTDLGYNYRLTDIQAALGSSQLTRLHQSLTRRREIAAAYADLLSRTFTDGLVRPLATRRDIEHAYHLYVVSIAFERLGVSRAAVMNRLRAQGIGTQVHYIPVHLQPYYRNPARKNNRKLPQAEAYYAGALSLPMYPELTFSDIKRVVAELETALVSQRQPAYRS